MVVSREASRNPALQRLRPRCAPLAPLALYASLLVAGSGAAGAQGTAPAATVRIGVITSLTGEGASSGALHLAGLRLALSEINARGGVASRPVELVIEDDGSRREQGVAAAEKLAKAKVAIVVGASSGDIARPVSQTLGRLRMPFISSGAAEEQLTRPGNEFTFRINNPSGVNARALLDQLGRIGGLKTAAVFVSEGAAGQATLTELRRSLATVGIDVVAGESYGAAQAGAGTDFAARLSAIRALKPDVVLLSPDSRDAAPLLRQVRAAGLTPAVMAGLSEVFSTPAFLKAAGQDAENLLTATDWNADVKYAGAALLYARLKQALGGQEPGAQAAQSYAALLTAADSLRRGGLLSHKVRAALLSTKLNTAFGPVSFRSYAGYTNQNSVISLITQVQGGKFTTVAPASVARGKLILPKR